MTHVLIAPYLPLARREVIGPWELIPRGDLKADDVTENRLVEAVTQLLNTYRLQKRTEVAFGVVIRPVGGKVGDCFDHTAPIALRQALLAAVLDTNPSPLMPEEEQTGNEGHQMVTSDNVLVFGHPLNGDRWIADQYGAMATKLVGGMQLGDPDAHFEAPGELIIPALEKPFDCIYASAVYEEVVKSTPAARRISRALDWLSIAWRNTSAIEGGTRIVALRAGFEVLLGVGDSTKDVRKALNKLLDAPDALRREQRWIENGKDKGPFSMTDLEWWFQKFSLLRNAIMHGDDIASESWQHEGQGHIWIAEQRLRRAIKESLISEGHPADLRDDPAKRQLTRAIAQHFTEESP